MRALGLTVELPSPNRPALRAVLLSDLLPAAGTPALTDVTVEETFEVSTAEPDRLGGWTDELRGVGS